MITEKEIGCDNCYYSYFDEKAYPCSLCIRGIERTDKWQPNKKTKADRKTENCSEFPNNSTISKMEQVDKDINVRSKTEPQRGCDADCNEDCTECAKEWQDWKDQMWAEAVIEPHTETEAD